TEERGRLQQRAAPVFDGEERPGATGTHPRSLPPGAASSLIRTLGRDLRATTVGSGIGPDLLTLRMAGRARGLAPVPLPGTAPTAGGEFHPALKTFGSVGCRPGRRRDSTTLPALDRKSVVYG